MGQGPQKNEPGELLHKYAHTPGMGKRSSQQDTAGSGVNREIKFRFRVHLPRNFHAKDSPAQIETVYCTLEDLVNNIHPLLIHTMTYIVSCDEWSGQVDKNGKEVYERDIVAYAIYQATVDFFEGCFGWKARLGANYRRPFLLKDIRSVEVVGNVYDNPELLTGAS